MGQGFGLPVPSANLKPFVNLPREAIESLWTSFNIYGEGFGLDFNSLLVIFRGATYLSENIGFSDSDLRALFESFDTDSNGLIDALELIITIAVLSGMDTIDKVNFAFNSYDFESTETLFYDEVTLLFRACSSGLKKSCPSQRVFVSVTNSDSESYASLFFQNLQRDKASEKINFLEFRSFCCTHPVVSSWLKMLSSIPVDTRPALATNGLDDLDITSYRSWPQYSVFESQLHAVKYNRVLNLFDMATKVTEKDFPEPVTVSVEPGPDVNSEVSSAPVPFREMTAEEEEELEKARAAEAEAYRIAALPPPPPLTWFKSADKAKPEEVPTLRKDAAQDTISPLWVHGFGSSAAPRMRRTGCYTATGAILYPASNHILALKKDEEGVWSQQILSEHKLPISCMDMDSAGNLLVTGDRIFGTDEYGDPTAVSTPPSVNIWNLKSGTVIASILAPCNALGIRYVDISADGKLLLVLLEDSTNTINIYSIETLELVFTKRLFDPVGEGSAVAERILDIKFSGTNSIFAIAGSFGVTFYVDEGASFMSPSGLKCYEKRAALYQKVGTDAVGSVATALSRFEYPDELAVGTATGQLTLWRGRNCIQLFQAHNGSVSTLHYSPETNTLVSGGKDGKINMYQIAPIGSFEGSNGGQRVVQTRQLEITATIDLMCQPGIISSYVRSLFLARDKTKVLVTTFGGEIKELSCLAVDPNAPEDEAAPPAEDGAEASGSVSSSNLGKDINGGSLVKVHYLKDFDLSKDADISSIYRQFIPKSAIVSSLCKVPGGFLSAGGDGTVRQWAAAEGEAHKCTKITAMDSGISLVAASNTLVACAYDGNLNLNKRGSVQIMTFPDMNYVTEIKPCAGDKVYDIKFSPEGNMLAIACRNNRVIFFKETEGVWNISGEIVLANIPLAFDFTSDGMFIRTTDKDPDDLKANYNLRYWDVSTNFGKEVLIGELIRSFQWNTYACPCAWDTKGIWNGLVELEPEVPAELAANGPSSTQPSARGSSSARASTEAETAPITPALPQPKPPRTIRRCVPFSGIDRSQSLCITGRRNGKVSLHRIPAFEYNPEPPRHSLVSLDVHLGRISCILFIEEGARLVTAGADDGVIQVWKVNYDTEEVELDSEDMPPKPEGEEEEEAPAEDDEEAAPTEVLVYDSADDEDMIDGKSLRNHLTIKKSTNDKLSAIRDWIPGVGVAIVGTGSRQGEHLLDVTTGQPLIGMGDSTLLPSSELELEWVYGYSGRLCRASVRYNSEGNVVYPAASFGIIFDKVNGRQTLANCHLDEVSCLDVHPTANVAASSHRGVGLIFVCVWNAVTGALLARLECGDVCGASALAFNPGNSDILAVAVQDPSHSILIFNWKSGKLVGSIAGSYKKTLCLAFSMSGLSPTPTTLDQLGNPIGGDGDHRACPRLIAGGVGHFRFIERSVGPVFTSRQGLFGAETKKSNCLCVVGVPITGNPESSEPEFFMGMSDGTIGTIAKGSGRQATFTPVLLDENGVNSGSVTAIWVVKTKEPTVEEPAEFRIVIGATNGVIKVLDQEMQPVSEWNLYGKQNYGLASFGKLRGFKSICVDRGNRKILYGTAGGEIGEIELQDGSDENQGPIVSGHFRDKLYGMAPHPLRQECATVGDDKMLRIWDLNKHKQILSIGLPDISRAVAFSPNGLMIAAGMGGEVSGSNRPVVREHAGQIAIVSYMQNDLRIVYIAEECKADITCLTFSPDGSRLFAGSKDCGIYVFDAVNNFKHLDTIVKHTESIKSIDLIADGSRMVSTGNGIEVIVWDVVNFEAIENDISPLILSQEWYSREAIYAIESIGAFPAFGLASDVLSVAYAKENNLIASADSNGVLHLRRSPATSLFAPSKKYVAHTPGGVSKVAFTLNDQRLLSIGTEDKTLIQWRLRSEEGLQADVLTFTPILGKSAQPIVKATGTKQGAFDDSFICNGLDIRRGGISGPSTDPIGVKLRSVVAVGADPGCNVPDMGPSAKLSSQYCGVGDIIMCSGRVVTSLLDDHLSQKQWVPSPSTNLEYQVNKDLGQGLGLVSAIISSTVQNISSISVSPCAKYLLVAGAGDNAFELDEKRELVRRGSLAVFDAATGEMISLLANDIEGGVLDTAFSRDGLFCCALGDDALHTVHLFGVLNSALGWRDCALHSKTHITRKVSSLVKFIKKTKSCYLEANTEYDFVCAGEDLPTFVTIKGRNVVASKGTLSEHVPVYPTTALCGLARSQCVATGDSAGFLWMYEQGIRNKQMFGFHTGPISAMCEFAIPSSAVFGVVSGSIDCVKVWDLLNMTTLSEFNITDVLSRVNRAAYLATIPTLGDSRQIKSILSGECTSGYVASVSVDHVFRRLLVTLSTGIVLEFARDSGSAVLVADGGMTTVSAISAHPLEADTLATIGEDKVLRLWSLAPSSFQPPRIIAELLVSHTASAVTWINDHLLAVGMFGGDTDGNSGAILLVEVEPKDSQPPLPIPSENGPELGNHLMERSLKVSSKLNNVGKGRIHQLRCSLPAGSAQGAVQLVACSDDGAVYIYDFAPNGMITFTGSIIVSPTQRYPIHGADFSTTNRYLRTFSKTIDTATPVDVKYFDFQAEEMKGDKKVIAVEVTKPEKMGDVLGQMWASVSSPICAEAEWTIKRGKSESSIPFSFASCPVEPSASRSLLAVGYTDGSVVVYRAPVCVNNVVSTPCHRIHRSGPVLVSFLAGAKTMVTVGTDDGSILLWDIYQ